MYKKSDNTSGTVLQMPIKWLALECIRNRIYSHKSDVWSFGTFKYFDHIVCLITYSSYSITFANF